MRPAAHALIEFERLEDAPHQDGDEPRQHQEDKQGHDKCQESEEKKREEIPKEALGCQVSGAFLGNGQESPGDPIGFAAQRVWKAL